MKALLVDGNYLVETCPASSLLDTLTFSIDMFKPDIVNVYWGSDYSNDLAGYSTSRKDWLPFSKDMVDGMSDDELLKLETPIKHRIRKIPTYLPEFGFYKKDIGYIESMKTISDLFTRLFVPEFWSFGYEVKDLIFTELMSCELRGVEPVVLGRLLYAPYLRNGCLYDLDKTYTAKDIFGKYGFNGGRLLNFFSLTRGTDFPAEEAKALITKHETLSKIIANISDPMLLAKFTENQALLSPFILKGIYGYQNPTTRFDEVFMQDCKKSVFKELFNTRKEMVKKELEKQKTK